MLAGGGQQKVDVGGEEVGVYSRALGKTRGRGRHERKEDREERERAEHRDSGLIPFLRVCVCGCASVCKRGCSCFCFAAAVGWGLWPLCG